MHSRMAAQKTSEKGEEERGWKAPRNPETRCSNACRATLFLFEDEDRDEDTHRHWGIRRHASDLKSDDWYAISRTVKLRCSSKSPSQLWATDPRPHPQLTLNDLFICSTKHWQWFMFVCLILSFDDSLPITRRRFSVGQCLDRLWWFCSVWSIC